MAKFSWKQRFFFIPPVILGGLLLVFVPGMKTEPPKATQTTGKKVVRVLKVVPRKIQPTAVGYGHAKPAHEWEAQAELDGTVIWISEDFKDGALIRKGSDILKLDPSYYELGLVKLNAEIEVAKLTDQTIRESVKIAEKDYQVQKVEYDRAVGLTKSGHLSKSGKDKIARELLGSQQQLQTLKNNLAINRAQQKVLQAELAIAKRDIENTVIRAPYDVRITEKMVDIAGYVNKGEVILRADGIDAVEVSAQLPLGKMRPLRRDSKHRPFDSKLHDNLEAMVELKAGEKTIVWDAKVNRSGGKIDAQTQSQSIVVRIEDPYKKAEPGKKPPLIRDTFVKVKLKAPVMRKKILLPVASIHNNKVYIVKEGKLEIRPVKVDFVQGQIAVIRNGVEKDDLVVLSKLSPAVEGMALKPQPDKKVNKWLDKETGFKAGKPDESKDKS